MWSVFTCQDVQCGTHVIKICLVANLILLTMYFRYQYEATTMCTEVRDAELVKRQQYNHESCSEHGTTGSKDKRALLHAYPYATNPNDPNPMIYISSWTEVQPDNFLWMESGTEEFERCRHLASWMKCHYTPNATQEELTKSHAVLFHVRHMTKERGIPKRDPTQKWIFYESEAPTNVWNYASVEWDYWDKFNLTSTFTLDSDIPIHHHRMVCKPKPHWYPTGVNHAATKTGKIAWFVSHCNTSSKRELYVNELKKYIPVDIFGYCGNNTVCKAGRPNRCSIDFINATYKFYLSFENAFCQEYVSEKLHDAVLANVIPIVLGQTDYSNIMPKGTYIDIRDFPSARDLAIYLKQLDQRDRLYNAYIENKNKYDCRVSYTSPKRFPCQLCEYLHLHRHEQEYVMDAATFWSVKNRCTSPLDFYRGVADDIIPNIQFSQHPELFL